MRVDAVPLDAERARFLVFASLSSAPSPPSVAALLLLLSSSSPSPSFSLPFVTSPEPFFFSLFLLLSLAAFSLSWKVIVPFAISPDALKTIFEGWHSNVT